MSWLLMMILYVLSLSVSFFFQAEDGIRDAQESRGLGDVYKRQVHATPPCNSPTTPSTQNSVSVKPLQSGMQSSRNTPGQWPGGVNFFFVSHL